MERRAFLSSLISGCAGFTATLCWPGPQGRAAELIETIKRIKKSVVAVGTYQRLRRPPAKLLGSGFAVADGRHIVTSAHVIPKKLGGTPQETLAVFIRTGKQNAEMRTASVVGTDRAHDVAILRISGAPLPAVRFGDDQAAEEGLDIAITGFPIGTVLGLRASTTRGILSAITPISLPQVSPQLLDPKMIRQLRDGFVVFQLDATAFPGNSGSPMYEARTGSVLGIVNSVFVKDTKERVLQDPSGITYATPIGHAKVLLKTLNLGR